MDWGVGRRYGQTAADTPHPVSHSWCGREKYGQKAVYCYNEQEVIHTCVLIRPDSLSGHFSCPHPPLVLVKQQFHGDYPVS